MSDLPAPESTEPPSRWARVAGALVYVDGPYPVDAVFEARDHWPEVREGFLEELTLAVTDPDQIIGEDNALPIYAMYLAAEKRDHAFAAPLIALLKLPVDMIDDLMGETTLTEGVGRCLASVWQGSDEPLRALAMDKALDDFVRDAAINAMVVRAFEGDADPDAVAALVMSVLQMSAATALNRPTASPGKRKRKEYDFFFNMLLSTLAELGATQYWPQVEQWHRDGLLDPKHQDFADMRDTMFASHEVRLARMFKPFYVRDTVEEMSPWACFNEPVPYIREQPKVGRNDSCPCGSGKKFKKCCGTIL